MILKTLGTCESIHSERVTLYNQQREAKHLCNSSLKTWLAHYIHSVSVHSLHCVRRDTGERTSWTDQEVSRDGAEECRRDGVREE